MILLVFSAVLPVVSADARIFQVFLNLLPDLVVEVLLGLLLWLPLLWLLLSRRLLLRRLLLRRTLLLLFVRLLLLLLGPVRGAGWPDSGLSGTAGGGWLDADPEVHGGSRLDLFTRIVALAQRRRPGLGRASGSPGRCPRPDPPVQRRLRVREAHVSDFGYGRERRFWGTRPDFYRNR